jgi:putative Mn2+ efflux pump MntP
MGILGLLILAIGLTFDTFAATVSIGILVNQIRFWQAFKIAFVLAIFQGLMPVLGYFAGSIFKDYLTDYDHWIAFVLLSFIGGKMINEALKKPEDKRSFNPFDLKVLILIAIATSMDALIIGVSLAFVKVNIIHAFFIIALSTGLVAMLGMLFGKKVGNLASQRAELIGGLLLIGLGIKILIEHLNQQL